LLGSAPATGAVFRALAENPGVREAATVRNVGRVAPVADHRPRAVFQPFSNWYLPATDMDLRGIARPARAGARPSGRFNGYWNQTVLDPKSRSPHEVLRVRIPHSALDGRLFNPIEGYLGLGSAPAAGAFFRALAEKGCSCVSWFIIPHSALQIPNWVMEASGTFWQINSRRLKAKVLEKSKGQGLKIGIGNQLVTKPRNVMEAYGS
jgi:hypothetical protein